MTAEVRGDHRPASPPARRPVASRWRDPRLWLGVLLVVGSMLVGAKVLAASDDTVGVWQVADDLRAGMAISPDSLVVAHVHFEDPSDAAPYLPSGVDVPAGARLAHDVSAGELLTRSAVRSGSTGVDELPLGVSSAGMLPDLQPGDRVDVWAVPGTDQPRRSSRRVLRDVTVLTVGSAAATGLTADRQVLVTLPAHLPVAQVLDGLNGASVVLIRVDG